MYIPYTIYFFKLLLLQKYEAYKKTIVYLNYMDYFTSTTYYQNQVAFELNLRTPSFIDKKKYFNLNEFAISDFVLFSATYTLSLTLCSPTGSAFFCG